LRVASAHLTVENSFFEKNQAKMGGAIYLLSGANVIISNSVFRSNQAQVRSFLVPFKISLNQTSITIFRHSHAALILPLLIMLTVIFYISKTDGKFLSDHMSPLERKSFFSCVIPNLSLMSDELFLVIRAPFRIAVNDPFLFFHREVQFLSKKILPYL
jgi:hypothetical protein